MKKTGINTLRNADWVGVENEVVSKIRLLKQISHGLDPNDLNDKIAEDLFLPALRLLAGFCTRIELQEDESSRCWLCKKPKTEGDNPEALKMCGRCSEKLQGEVRLCPMEEGTPLTHEEWIERGKQSPS